MVICFVHKGTKFSNLCSKLVTFGKTIISLIQSKLIIKKQTVNTFKMAVLYKRKKMGGERFLKCNGF